MPQDTKTDSSTHESYKQAIDMKKRFFRSKEAAEYTGYAESSLRTYRVKGGGPEFIKRGRIVLYPIDALDRWIGDDRRTSTSDPGR